MPNPLKISIGRPAKQAPARPTHCLDCGRAVPADHIFCGYCGQENEASPVSFVALVREGWEEFVKVDAKLLRTLSLLLFRPGFLSGEYVIGRRNRYLSPFKMYVVISALFFLIFALLIPFDKFDGLEDKAQQIETKLQTERKKAEAEKKAGVKPSEKAPQKDQETENSKNLISFHVSNSNDPKTLPSLPPAKKVPTVDKVPAVDSEDSNSGEIEFWQDLRKKPIHFFGSDFVISTLPDSVSEYREKQATTEPSKRDRALVHFLKERLIRFKSNPGDTMKNLLSTGLPLLMLIQLPLFAGIMRMFYFRQKRLYVEHLVFLLHTHSLFFLLFGIVMGIDAAARNIGQHFTPLDHGSTWLVLTLIIALYNFLALRRFYSQGFGKTLVKSWFLWHGYLLLLGISVSLAAVVAILWTVIAPP